MLWKKYLFFNRSHQENLLNGGAFGFEGSILSVFSMIILILIELYYRKKN
jgi:hypothetical protein